MDACEKIIELVDILPVVDRFAVTVLTVDSHVVAQKPMHADVLEAANLLGVRKMPLPIGP